MNQNLHAIPTEPALKIKDVAIELQCSKTHVQNLIHGRVEGVPPFPFVKTGRMYRVRRASLDHWMEQRENDWRNN